MPINRLELLLWLLLMVVSFLPPAARTARVIYFNALNETAKAKATAAEEEVGKSMLLDVRRVRCRPGFMRDHHGRCRMIV